MEVADFLTSDRVTILSGQTKRDALEEMIALMAASVPEVTAEELGQAVWRREALMSTGIGHGLAIPHVRMPALKNAYMAVGVSHCGISDYESLDPEPTRIIVMIAAPQGQHETYIRLLAKVTETLKDADARQAMIAAQDASAVYRLLAGGGR